MIFRYFTPAVILYIEEMQSRYALSESTRKYRRKETMKKINRKIALLCCFLMPCILLCGCQKEGGEYNYIVYNINEDSADVYEDYFAMSDQYAEPDRICEVATYNDLIIYREYEGNDFYICPAKGNPQTDSINLRSLIEAENIQEQDVQKGVYQVQEVFYQGLRVVFFREDAGDDYRVLGILDAESKEIIWTNVSNPLNYLGSVFWGEGEWIIFTRSSEGNFYQREGEADRHRFECLDDPKYKAIGIAPSLLTMEGECLVGLMSTHNPIFGYFRYNQEDEDNDILFEINLETNTSRIIYETDKAQTRIIGYKNGVVYLLEDDVIYRGWIDRPEREEIYDLLEQGWKLYTAEGEHICVGFRWQGDNLILQTKNKTRSICISDCPAGEKQ